MHACVHACVGAHVGACVNACVGAHVHACMVCICVHACMCAHVHVCMGAYGSLRTTLGATYFFILVVVLFLFFEARVSPRPRTHQVGQEDWPAILGPCHRSSAQC